MQAFAPRTAAAVRWGWLAGWLSLEGAGRLPAFPRLSFSSALSAVELFSALA
jgi:hypothetical protein